MKYLKIYENFDDSHTFVEYWKIPTSDPKLTIALNKIGGCKLKKCDFYESNIRYKNISKFGNRKYVYIMKLITIDKGNIMVNWHWNNGTKIIKTYNNRFMGDIKVSKDDVKKYKIEQDSKKYNL